MRLALALLVLVVAAPAHAQDRVLLTGDSQMEVLQRRLAPDLAARGWSPRVDARVGSGLTRPFVVDWVKYAAKQSAEIKPAATVVFLGAGDVDDFAGVAKCCGEKWVATYARRLAQMRRAYGNAYWLTLPAPAHPDLARVNRAVNRAIRRSVPYIDLAAVIAPHDRFQRRMRWGGVLRTIRASDGVHLSPWGSLIASAVIGDWLELQAQK